MQYVAAGVDSVAHRHKLVCVGNTEPDMNPKHSDKNRA